MNAAAASCTLFMLLVCPPVPAASSAAYDAYSRSGSYERLRGDTGSFTVYYPPRRLKLAKAVEKELAQSVHVIASELGLEHIDTMQVFIAADGESYRRLHGGILPEWSAAFSAPRSRMLGIDAEAVLRSPRPLRTVLRHELSHLLFAQRTENAVCPVWFVEGLAMMQSHEWTLSDQWKLTIAAARKQLPQLDDLAGPFPAGGDEAHVAYMVSYAAVEELCGERPEDLVTLTAFICKLQDFDEAFRATFGESPAEFDLRFSVIIGKRYRAAGTLIQTSPFWIGLSVLFVLAYTVKRVKSRRRRERLGPDGFDDVYIAGSHDRGAHR